MAPDDASTPSAEDESLITGPSPEWADWSPEKDPTTPVLRTLKISGQLELAIFHYYHTSFQSRLWVSDGEDTHCRSVKAPPKICDMIARFKHNLISACNYIRQQGTRYGFVYLHQESEKIKDIVFAESPRVIEDLIETSLWLIQQGRYDVVKIFLQQFAEMSTVLNSESQAIYQILAEKSKSDEPSFVEAALNTWRFIADCFVHELGSRNVTALRCYTNWLVYFADSYACDRSICRTKCNHAEYTEKVLRCDLERCDDAHGPVSYAVGDGAECACSRSSGTEELRRSRGPLHQDHSSCTDREKTCCAPHGSQMHF
jgi:hypothetical protein